MRRWNIKHWNRAGYVTRTKHRQITRVERAGCAGKRLRLADLHRCVVEAVPCLSTAAPAGGTTAAILEHDCCAVEPLLRILRVIAF